MNAQAHVPDPDLTSLRNEVAMLRTTVKADSDALESRLTHLIVQSESRQGLALERMGASLREEIITLRVRLETLIPALATKADLLDHGVRVDTLIPTLATKADLLDHKARVDTLIPTLATKADVLDHSARIDTLIPTLATKTDLASVVTLIPTLATKADLLELKASMRAWFISVTMSLFVAFTGLCFAVVNLAAHP